MVAIEDRARVEVADDNVLLNFFFRHQLIAPFDGVIANKHVDPFQEVARGESGEVVVRGYNVMRGYFDDETETRKAIDAANVAWPAWLSLTGKERAALLRRRIGQEPQRLVGVRGQHHSVEAPPLAAHADVVLVLLDGEGRQLLLFRKSEEPAPAPADDAGTAGGEEAP